MFDPVLAVILAAALTVAEGGVLFQPALSEDGTMVAYAADEDGRVSIYVAPVSESGARTRVAEVGQGARGRRLASRALLCRPFSPDGSRLLFIAAPQSPTMSAHEQLFTVAPDGSDARLIGPAEGLVESASWLKAGSLVFAHRESRRAEKQFMYLVDTARDPAPLKVDELEPGELALDVTPSPDGRWLAMIQLHGPRDARERRIRILDLKGAGRVTLLEHTASANFLTWARDSSRLYYVDTATHEVPFWASGDAATSPPLAREISTIEALDGALLCLERSGALVGVDAATGERSKVLGRGFAPTSAGGGKVAFVRLGAKGAAVVVADVTNEAIRAGDIGLPGGGSGDSAPGTAPGMENGSARPARSGDAPAGGPPG